jgi:hypothetical protein
MSLGIVRKLSVGSLFDMCIGLVAHLLREVDLSRVVITVSISLFLLLLLLLLPRVLLLNDHVRIYLVYLN